MTLWAGLCLVLFLITFLATRERIEPVKEEQSSPRQDFKDLLKNIPWRVMAIMTLVHFAILSFRGGALYNYYHHYADKTAMYGFLAKLGLTGAAGASGGFLETLGYLVHGDKSNVADVFNSIINMVGTGTTILVIILSPPLSRKFGKKAVAVAGFGLAIGVLTWLIRTIIDYRRWSRLSKVQAEIHTKLLDRFSSNEELAAYIQSPAGSRFLESSPIRLDPGPRSLGGESETTPPARCYRPVVR